MYLMSIYGSRLHDREVFLAWWWTHQRQHHRVEDSIRAPLTLFAVAQVSLPSPEDSLAKGFVANVLKANLGVDAEW